MKVVVAGNMAAAAPSMGAAHLALCHLCHCRLPAHDHDLTHRNREAADENDTLLRECESGMCREQTSVYIRLLHCHRRVGRVGHCSVAVPMHSALLPPAYLLPLSADACHMKRRRSSSGVIDAPSCSRHCRVRDSGILEPESSSSTASRGDRKAYFSLVHCMSQCGTVHCGCCCCCGCCCGYLTSGSVLDCPRLVTLSTLRATAHFH